MKPVATYCYCVVAGTRAPRTGRERGLPGMGRPRILPAGRGLWLLAASAPLDRYGADAINRGLQDLNWVSACALAHEAVIEELGRRATVVPMKLFTLFASDENAQEHIERAAPRLLRAVRRVAGCAEWGVRIALDQRKAIARVRAETARSAARSGRAFLLAKKKQAAALSALGGAAHADADAAYAKLAGRARAARKRPPPPGEVGARMLLDAVFLVAQRRGAGFRKAAKLAAARLGKSGYLVTVTGPWPPYHFVS